MRSNEAMTLTVKQMADRLQVSMPTAYALTEQADFPVLRVGKKKLIPISALERWVEAQTGKADCRDA